ncbi:hypothetical protein OSB04_026598 [Centaurea solstitialis]|uniref:MADS-box domain-containing protein n=1 Tax=Centaurea solstitialis TaxID=347529 RepID=A0AA38VYW5_9ASTR|nr:hypothetical protein OSB04_026598 [Centaurea solstitialis]
MLELKNNFEKQDEIKAYGGEYARIATIKKKKAKSCQKIEITKILDEKSLAVTFSKRHSGLFSKANELCILCGVQLAIIMFSPTKKPISYGNPSVEAITDRYLEQLPPLILITSQFMEAYRTQHPRTKQTTHQHDCSSAGSEKDRRRT